MKDFFFDSWGGMRFRTVVIMVFVCSAALLIALDEYIAWQCQNFSDVTGREVKYIHYDSCYVKNKKGEFIRYDSHYKE